MSTKINKNKYTICLNMIVKNESHIIEKTLENICKYIPITYYIISDTGSTDNTIDIINNFFFKKNIKGEIFNDEWKDFGYNRSLALTYAYNKTDYLFIFDADDEIIGDFIFPDKLDKNGYYLKFGNKYIYKRVLLINNKLEWEFIGVLHEYISCKTIYDIESYYSFIDGNYYVESGKVGNRSNDPQKHYKDAIILENAFNTTDNKSLKTRYSFYCAQSYRDFNQKETSIEWYKKRIELAGWEQEVYVSYYMIGYQYIELGNIEKAIYYWTLAYDIDDRYECHYEVISYYRQNGKYKLAFNFYKMIENYKPDLSNKLFIIMSIYTYLLDYELSFILCHVNQYNLALIIFKKLFIINEININLQLNIINNFMFYLNNIKIDFELIEYYTLFIKNIFRKTKLININFITNINKTIEYFTGFYRDNYIENENTSFFNNNSILKYNKKILSNKNKNIKIFLSITSCKRYKLFYNTINSLLICFKDINKIDYFFCVDDNSSVEDREKMRTTFPFFKYYFKKDDEKGHLTSMNIIWNKLNELKPKYWIHIEDDWLFFRPDNYIERSINFIEKYKYKKIHQLLFNKNYAETIFDYNMVGGEYIEDNNYIIHIKDEPNLVGGNCAYWAHYSFRPSIVLVETILHLGNFNSSNTFFEAAYANKYYDCGFSSAFFNEITSIHMGRLTNEKNSNNKNAYQLNNIEQFDKSIQNISELFKNINVDYKIINNKYIYIKSYDHFGDDIKYINNLSIDELIKICENNKNIICFNSMGYLKHTIDINNLIFLNNENEGLYINIQKFEELYNIKLNNNY